jgi:hypothetical protein
MDPGWEERLSKFLGETARPISIILVALAVTFAICWLAVVSKQLDGSVGFVFTIGGILCALYGAKALETASVSKHQAQSDIAKATAGAPTPASGP